MNGTILIVDDDEDAAALLRDLLRRCGLDVTAVSSGRQCLEQLRSHPADVVVTDVQMPGMSGTELCVTLREHHPDLLPLIITGRSDPESALAAIRTGAFDFITKPLESHAVEVPGPRTRGYLLAQR